jgi:hypothetical protein
MTGITFKEHLDKSIAEQPELGTYIHFCRVLGESFCERDEIENLFDRYMPKDEYDKPERTELVDYLFKISKELPPK